ncbi:MAG: diguanylate cyclase [Polyangiaceae bacterium]
MGPRIVLIDPEESTRSKLTRRLESLGYAVEATHDGVAGVGAALANPPLAVIADLWTGGFSGVQLCRFLMSEPATATVPVFLRGDEQNRRNRYWAARAGAKALLNKERTGELLRALHQLSQSNHGTEAFFMQLSKPEDVHARILQHLDDALFESALASEIRSLASCESIHQLFDQLVQFASQIMNYSWLSLSVPCLRFWGLHHHPSFAEIATHEAHTALRLGDSSPYCIDDDDARAPLDTGEVVVAEVMLGGGQLARLAAKLLSDDAGCVRGLARELSAPLRVAILLEETRELATTDALTGAMNRRATDAWLKTEAARADRYGIDLTIAMLDIDHFKHINDTYGHAAGDRVLTAVIDRARAVLRNTDGIGRWGGEEFVVVLPHTSIQGAERACERLRSAIEALAVHDEVDQPMSVTASFGVVRRAPREPVAEALRRADAAMFKAKLSGRNRVHVDDVASVNERAAPANSLPADVIPAAGVFHA